LSDLEREVGLRGAEPVAGLVAGGGRVNVVGDVLEDEAFFHGVGEGALEDRVRLADGGVGEPVRWAVRAVAVRAGHGEAPVGASRSEEHTSELQSREKLVCRLLLEKKTTIRNVRR